MLSPKANRVLFICHIANLSGAPVLLLEIIKEIKTKTLIEFEIIIVVDGALSKDFEALGKVHYWNPISVNSNHGLFSPIVFRIDKWKTILHRKKILKAVSKTKVVFMNTITNGQVLKELLKMEAKHICYVHEMSMAMLYATNKKDLETVLKHTDLFLACSNSVKQNLIAAHGITEQKVRVMNTPIKEFDRNKSSYKDFQEKFRSEYGIPSDAVIVGVVGPNEWRKGFDFFLPLITLYFELYPDSDVFFVWKGFSLHSSTGHPNLFDYEKNVFMERVILLPHGKDAIEIISCLDIHLLLSREDPYPLVVLESASFGIPTISFEGTGGAIEFIEQDAGFVVPYCNLFQMASKLNEMVRDPGLRLNLGQRAKQKLKQRHAADVAMAPFVEVIEHAQISFTTLPYSAGKEEKEIGILNSL